MEEWIDRWMDGLMKYCQMDYSTADGRMDKQMDGWINEVLLDGLQYSQWKNGQIDE